MKQCSSKSGNYQQGAPPKPASTERGSGLLVSVTSLGIARIPQSDLLWRRVMLPDTKKEGVELKGGRGNK